MILVITLLFTVVSFAKAEIKFSEEDRFGDCEKYAKAQARMFNLTYEEEYYEFRNCFDDEYSFYNEPCN